jgi:predicted metal-dependent phosphoesterase TrpH
MLKTDLHTHSKEDRAVLSYTTKELIKVAAKNKFDVISITVHGRNYYPLDMVRYAKKLGVLLFPGREAHIEGRHVLIYNHEEPIKKLAHLDRVQQENGLVIAPHPYFIVPACLGRKLVKYIDYFDAIEYSHFYTKYFNLNRKALKIAKKYKKAIIGTSDIHFYYEFNKTFSLIDADKKIDSILEAIRKRKTKLVTKPMTTSEFLTRTKHQFFPKR